MLKIIDWGTSSALVTVEHTWWSFCFVLSSVLCFMFCFYFDEIIYCYHVNSENNLTFQWSFHAKIMLNLYKLRKKVKKWLFIDLERQEFTEIRFCLLSKLLWIEMCTSVNNSNNNYYNRQNNGSVTSFKTEDE